MRRIFLLLIVLIMLRLCAFAQVQILNRHIRSGDALLNTKKRVEWVGNNISIVETDSESATIYLNNKGKSHIFIQGSVLIGYYNMSKELLYKTNSYLTKYDIEQGNQLEWFSVAFSKDSVPYSKYSDDEWVLKKTWRVKVSDILRWLKESDGYIRIVSPMYGGTHLDVMFTINKKED